MVDVTPVRKVSEAYRWTQLVIGVICMVMILEIRSALASDNPAQRQMAIKTLWFFAYFGLLAGAWIAYAAMLGI